MNALLSSFTALPNLHPAVVHFPIALAFTALALELISLLRPRQKWLDPATATLYLLAALAGVAAFFAGRAAADGLGSIPTAAEVVLANHADLALWTIILLGLAAILRVIASIRTSDVPVARLDALRGLALLLMLGAAGLVGFTADLGGALVYRHGTAVRRPSTGKLSPERSPIPPRPAGKEESPSVRLLSTEDGGLDWQPAAIDLKALGTFLTPLNSEGSTVSTVPGEGEGLGLRVAGETLLLLPGQFDDVVTEARVDLGDFKGSVGLAHHVGGPDAALIFVLTPEGNVSLIKRTEAGEKMLGSGKAEAASGVVTLQSAGAGKHLKAFIDGTMVVHGHGLPGPAGRCGLYLNGKGIVRILSMKIEPASGH